MDKATRISEIDKKCQAAGCNEKAQKRHLQLFVYENWDPHPPKEFVEWYAKHGPGPFDGKPANPIPGWNSARTREDFKMFIRGEL